MSRNAELGPRLKAERRHRGLTQKHLGALAGCSSRTVRNVEKGIWQPSATVLAALCEALRLRIHLVREPD